MGQTACEIPVTPHSSGVGIRAYPLICLPVRRVPQLTGVNFMVFAGAAPDPVPILTDIIHIGGLRVILRPESWVNVSFRFPTMMM